MNGELLRETDAKRLAEVLLGAVERQAEARLTFVDDPIVFHNGWLFLYDAAAYVETGNEDEAIGGNAPIVVFAEGRVEFGNTHESVETQIDRLNLSGS